MHPRVFAERRADAQQRQRIAAGIIAAALGIDVPAEVKERDTDIRILKESESIAEWLEQVAAQVAKPKAKAKS